MGKKHKMRKVVEADPEWFLGGVPLPPKLASKWSTKSTPRLPDGKVAPAKQMNSSRRKRVRNILREMAYSTEE